MLRILVWWLNCTHYREETKSNEKREDLKTNEEPKKYKILDEDEDMFATSSPEPDLIYPFESQTMVILLYKFMYQIFSRVFLWIWKVFILNLWKFT